MVTFREKSTKKPKPSEKKFNSNSKLRRIDCSWEARKKQLKALDDIYKNYEGGPITDYTYEELKIMLKWNR